MKTLSIILTLCLGYTLFATEYTLKLPIPSNVEVNEDSGVITIKTSFKPSRALNVQLNHKIDRKHAERICVEGLRHYFNVGNGSLRYSKLQSVGSPSYTEGQAVYVFSLPKSGVKVIPGQQTAQNTKVNTSVNQTNTSSIAGLAVARCGFGF